MTGCQGKLAKSAGKAVKQQDSQLGSRSGRTLSKNPGKGVSLLLQHNHAHEWSLMVVLWNSETRSFTIKKKLKQDLETFLKKPPFSLLVSGQQVSEWNRPATRLQEISVKNQSTFSAINQCFGPRWHNFWLKYILFSKKLKQLAAIQTTPSYLLFFLNIFFLKISLNSGIS